MLADALAHAAKLDGDAPAFSRTVLDYYHDPVTGRLVYEGRRARMVPVTTDYALGVSAHGDYLRAMESERCARRNRVTQVQGEADRVAARVAAFHARTGGRDDS